jgi:triacylglycerol esterase/lipase EstA (alpha/beta hydrolase family)
MRRTVVVLVAAVMLTITTRSAVFPSVGTAATAHRRDPVLLVHGFNGSGASWHTLEAQLHKAGYRDDEISAISYDSTRSNVAIAGEIDTAVDTLRARTGARTVDIVSHSMGSISARYYIEHLSGNEKVDAFVSLAGVNRGTIWAIGCAVHVSCREMLPGSAVIDGFAPDVTRDAPTRFRAWWSPCDPAIVPHANAELRGAENTETACIGHSDLKTDPRVLRQVLAFIGRRHTQMA